MNARMAELEKRLAELERQHEALLEALRRVGEATGIALAPEPARDRPGYLRAVK